MLFHRTLAIMLQTMLVSQKSTQSMAFMVIIAFLFVQCQAYERRAVSEHQLMHERGRNIQNLKRLIWLSNAMDRLHMAQTPRAPWLDYDRADCRAEAAPPFPSHQERGCSSGLLQMLWSAAHKSIPSLPETKK